MTLLAYRRFLGEIPRIDPHVLPEGYASVAVNLDPRAESMTPLRVPSLRGTVGVPPVSRGILRAGARKVVSLLSETDTVYWMFADPEAYLCLSPVPEDQYERVYATTSFGGGRPSGIDGPQYVELSALRNGGMSGTDNRVYRLGVPSGPDFLVSATGGSGTSFTRVYVATYVTFYGEEGPIGPPISASGPDNATWTVQSYSGAIPAPGPNRVTRIRFYRALQSTGSYRFVRDVMLPPHGDWVASFVDSVSEPSLSLRFSAEQDNDAPPATMQGIVAHPNGFLAGFLGRDIYLSKPFLPHAWPRSYVVRLQHDVVALRVAGNSLFALTTSVPIVLTGSSPLSLQPVDLGPSLPCLSGRSAVVYKESVIYASTDGLAAATLGGAQLISTDMVSAEQWRSQWFAPGLQAVLWNDHYLALSGTTGFLFPLATPRGMVRLQLPFTTSSLDTQDADGGTTLLSGSSLLDWQRSPAAAYLRAIWSSPITLAPKPLNMAAFHAKTVRGTTSIVDQEDMSDLLAFNQQAILDRPTGVVNGARIGVPTLRDDYPTSRPLPGDSDLGFGGLYRAVPSSPSEQSVLVVRVLADDRSVFEQSQPNDEMRRLPAGYKATRWNVELVATCPVVSFAAGETGKELARAS